MYEGLQEGDGAPEEGSRFPEGGALTIESAWEEDQGPEEGNTGFAKQQKEPYQIHASYIVSHIKSGYLLIDQQAAHERILYEKYLKVLNEQAAKELRALLPPGLKAEVVYGP